MIKNVLIVEDDYNNANFLMHMIAEMPAKTKCYWAKDLKDAYLILHQNKIDLFLLDIILNPKDSADVSGLYLADEIRNMSIYKHTPIIFITSLADPKLYAYTTIHSYSYIEKPFLIEKTKKIIEDALTFFSTEKEEQYFRFRKDGILLSAKIEEIVYIESKGHMLHLHTIDDFMKVPYISCKEVLKRFERLGFIQCAKGVIVNKKYIMSIDTVNRFIGFGKLYENKQISVSRNYIKAVIDEMDGWK